MDSKACSDIEPLVTLKPDQAAAERFRQHLADFGFPNPGFALKKQRAVELEGKKERRGEGPIGDIAAIA